MNRANLVGKRGLRGWLLSAALWMAWTVGALTVHAADPAKFVQGNERYAAGDFSGAAKAYEEQVRSGQGSANLFYNLGDAYYRAGDKGRAVLNFRRALILEPGHAEAAANLAFITAGRSTVNLDGTPRVLLNAVAWAAAACAWLGVAGLLTLLASRRRVLGVAMTLVGFLLAALGAGTVWFFSGGDPAARAVVVAEATPALYSPVEGAKQVASLPAGGEVRVLSEQGAWTYVLLGEGATRAWVASKNVERLVPR